MVILQAQAPYFVIAHFESDSPVAGNRNAPLSGTVPRELVNTPARRRKKLRHVFRQDQSGDDAPNPLYEVLTYPTGIVVFDKASQAPVANASNQHLPCVR